MKTYEQLNRRKKTKIEIDENDRNETTHKLFGVSVNFPGKPYGPQLSMMSFIIQAIMKKQNALLESPTGTGKTLSILCGALAAFEALPSIEHARIFYCVRTHSQLSQVVSELGKTSYRVPMTVLGARARYCLNEEVRRAENVQHACSDARHEDKCAYYRKYKADPLSFNFPELPDDVWQLEHLREFGERDCICPYYVSTALSKHSNLIICPYQYVLDPRIGKITLEKNDILIFDEAHNMEDASREAFSRQLTFHGVQNVISEMFSLFHFYPKFVNRYGLFFYVAYFFLQWMMSAEAKDDSVIYMPALRAAIEKVSIKSMNMLNRLKLLMDLIKDDHFELRKQQPLLTLEEDIFNVLSESPVAEMDSTDPEYARTLTNVLEFERYNYNNTRFEINNYLLSHTFDEDETKEFTSITMTRKSTGILSFHAIEIGKELVAFLKIVLSDSRDETIDPVRGSLREVDQTRIASIYSLDPSLVFKPLAESVRCVILASGTLAPFLSFESELGVKFPVVMEGKHVIKPEDQIRALALSHSKDNYPLRCVYKEISLQQFQDELGKTILTIAKCVPEGVLCFFPSYSMMNNLRFRWMQSGLWGELGKVKKLFLEPQDARLFPENIEKYYEAVKDPLGAMMFAIFRGKCSEGMDFTDGKSRAVISIGIPLPNYKDVIVNEKMRYNTIVGSRYPEQNRVNGSDWYSLQAWRAVNQALGRCIRHINDYGCMILIDARFNESKQNTSSDCSMVSGWIRNNLVHESILANAEVALKQFFAGKK
jgi:DNA repair helicase Rad3